MIDLYSHGVRVKDDGITGLDIRRCNANPDFSAVELAEIDQRPTATDVEGTILQKLKEIGYNPETEGHLFWKKNKIDGFYSFNKIRLPSLSTQQLDVYFKVVQKNVEEKSNSTLYLLVSSGAGTFASPVVDTLLWNNSEMFLNSFLAWLGE